MSGGNALYTETMLTDLFGKYLYRDGIKRDHSKHLSKKMGKWNGKCVIDEKNFYKKIWKLGLNANIGKYGTT